MGVELVASDLQERILTGKLDAPARSLRGGVGELEWEGQRAALPRGGDAK